MGRSCDGILRVIRDNRNLNRTMKHNLEMWNCYQEDQKQDGATMSLSEGVGKSTVYNKQGKAVLSCERLFSAVEGHSLVQGKNTEAQGRIVMLTAEMPTQSICSIQDQPAAWVYLRLHTSVWNGFLRHLSRLNTNLTVRIFLHMDSYGDDSLLCDDPSFHANEPYFYI